jgi:hypothetical protein
MDILPWHAVGLAVGLVALVFLISRVIWWWDLKRRRERAHARERRRLRMIAKHLRRRKNGR